MDTVEEIKAAISRGEDVSGRQFKNAGGAIGTVKPGLSVRSKHVAILSCSVNGCTSVHEREISDWHQCHKCKVHAKVRLRDLRRRNKSVDTESIRKKLAAHMAKLQVHAADLGIDLNEVNKESAKEADNDDQ